MMKKIMQPCGLHCIKMQDIGVTIGEQNILQHVNLHIHCGCLLYTSPNPLWHPGGGDREKRCR